MCLWVCACDEKTKPNQTGFKQVFEVHHQIQFDAPHVQYIFFLSLCFSLHFIHHILHAYQGENVPMNVGLVESVYQKWSVRDENQLVRTFNRKSNGLLVSRVHCVSVLQLKSSAISKTISWIVEWVMLLYLLHSVTMRLRLTAEWLSVSMVHHISGIISVRRSTVTFAKARTERKYFDHAQLKPFSCELLEHFKNVYAQWVMDIASHHPIRYIPLIHLLESEYEFFNQIYQRKLDFSYKFDAVVSHFHFFLFYVSVFCYAQIEHLNQILNWRASWFSSLCIKSPSWYSPFFFNTLDVYQNLHIKNMKLEFWADVSI